MGVIFFISLASLVILILTGIYWYLTDKEGWSGKDIIAAVTLSIISITVVVLMWFAAFEPAIPYTNEQNIVRYEELLEKVEYGHNNPDSPFMETLYAEIDEWNKEYNDYQNKVGNWWNGIRYPEGLYDGCSEIDFWEMYK